MKLSLSLLAAASAITGTLSAATDPVCIVGAGPAGLTIANRLESKGYNAVILEKNAEVGGKCQAYYESNGLFHPMGALLYSNETYTETLPIIDASGLPSYSFSYTVEGWLFNWTDGSVVQSPAPDQLYPLIEADVQRYINFWQTEFAPNLTAIGYTNGVPEELTVPFAQWLSQNGYNSTVFSTIIQQGMVPYGYGSIDETPAIYMLQYFTPDILNFFAGQHTGYITDFHELFVQYANTSIKSPILTSTNITSIVRSGSSPVITYAGQSGVANQSCSKLVLAFPPVIPALEAAHLDISANETAVFSPIVTTKYWSGAVQTAGIPDGDRFSAQTFEPEGQPAAFFRLFDASPIATTWSWGTFGSNQTLEDANALLESTLSKLNKDPSNATAPSLPVTDDDVKDFREWDYFAHYEPQELQNGFYARFEALQGQLDTYYASGFNGFETVEFAIRAGNDIVDTYFS